MAKKEFIVGDRRYTPGPIVRYNGTRGRFWAESTHSRNCWIQTWVSFHPLRATRKDIHNAPCPENDF